MSNPRMNYHGAKVAITGANGYLGSALASEFATSVDQLVLQGRTMPLAPTGSATIACHAGDLATLDAWHPLLDNTDVIFHLAAHEQRQFDPWRDAAGNATAVLQLLELCRTLPRPPHIVFASSANLVGGTNTVPFDEECADHPETIFAIHKLAAEHYLQLYAREFGLSTITLRLVNVYGPSINRVITERATLNHIIATAVAQQRIPLFNNRECLRDYLFITDALQAFCAAGLTQPSRGQRFLVGSGTAYTFTQLAQLIADAVAQQGMTRPAILTDDTTSLTRIEYRQCAIHTTKFSALTGWHPKTSVPRGIAQMVDYFRIRR